MAGKAPELAILYDFDKTLCTKDMQEYTFIPQVGLRPEAFWAESGKLAKTQQMDRILAYMYLMLKSANAANRPIRREDLVALGKDLEYFPGVAGWFQRMNARGERLGLDVRHYVISSGLREIIEGSSIYKHFAEVFACEYFYGGDGVAVWPKNVVNYTTKTQFLFRINKGIPDISNDDDLNRYTPEDERAVPFRNMIYIGDGYTDVPSMKLVKAHGGCSIAVYAQPWKETVHDLLREDRVDFFAPADYTENSELDRLVGDVARKIAVEQTLYDKSKAQRDEVYRCACRQERDR